MNNLRHFLRAAVFIALQVLLFNRLSLGTWVYPLPYLLVLLLLPFSYSTIGLMLWGFGMGLCIDVLGTGIPGVHASAGLVLGLTRNVWLRLMATKEESEGLNAPGFDSPGASRYVVFVALCLLVHHTVLFFLESFSLTYGLHILLRILCSGTVNLALLLVLRLMYTPSAAKKR